MVYRKKIYNSVPQAGYESFTTILMCRCEKCNMDLNNFKWRLMLSINIGDFSDGVWGTCFQVTLNDCWGK